MKASEILRKLADKIDQMSDGPEDAGTNRLHPIEVDNTDHTEPGELMIPPLQAKLELLKKATGVESAYDDETDQSPDELELLKKNAGVAPIAIQVAEEDEPFEG